MTVRNRTAKNTARALLAAGLIAAAAACNTSTETTVPGTTPTDGGGILTSPGAPTISAGAAAQLCDMMRPEITTWRDQGVALGKVAFNGTVQNWAARNNGINAAILRDKEVVDQVTTIQCPDVRQEALQALQIDSLADALAGF
ncbi:hypothetical protein [Nocardia huaxiensis]|uniref:Lipoprotein n=1 Tax=Nocardia huaxiensis TaxID=2755382 RepID=A0A7D6V505_9NOCA|nr:hypothetical protein [Nocardia huaxiensis]QLY27661.1 hypothetical protein H0264_19510 [Nocardia huaxiensis]UFS98951.1 hypothetical protein LPY97_14190 [Nocardia huaxiensis]